MTDTKEAITHALRAVRLARERATSSRVKRTLTKHLQSLKARAEKLPK